MKVMGGQGLGSGAREGLGGGKTTITANQRMQPVLASAVTVTMTEDEQTIVSGRASVRLETAQAEGRGGQVGWWWLRRLC